MTATRAAELIEKVYIENASAARVGCQYLALVELAKRRFEPRV